MDILLPFVAGIVIGGFVMHRMNMIDIKAWCKFGEKSYEKWFAAILAKSKEHQRVIVLRRALIAFRKYFCSRHETGYGVGDIEALKSVRDALHATQDDE